MSAKNYRWWWPLVSLLFLLLAALLVFFALYHVPRAVKGLGILLVQGELAHVVSPDYGILDSWFIEEGAPVDNNQALAKLITPQNHNISIKAPKQGTMAEIIAYPGTQVSKGENIALISPYGDARHHLELIGFVSSLEGKKIKAGMTAHIWPSITNSYHDGALIAKVKQVGKLPMAKAAVQSIIKIPSLAKYIRNNIEAEPFLVILALEVDPKHPSGYRWTKTGPSFELDSGIISNFDIIYDSPSLLELSWPFFRNYRFSLFSSWQAGVANAAIQKSASILDGHATLSLAMTKVEKIDNMFRRIGEQP